MAGPVTLLQLDTRFARIAGDVGSSETFDVPLEKIVIKGAEVSKIVTQDPGKIDIRPFEKALKGVTNLAATSCGFLSYWQEHLQQNCASPFVSSALIDLPKIARSYPPDEVTIITFDDQKLGLPHLPKGTESYARSIIGLDPKMHLRDVISNDLLQLDVERSQAEFLSFCKAKIDTLRCKAILLECTNLPPYKAALKKAIGVEVFDILTAIETRSKGTVRPQFL